MILPQMTDDEKGYQAFRIRDLAKRWAYKFREEVLPKFDKAFKYPYSLFKKHDDGYGNEWTLLFCLPCKEDKKRGRMRALCFTTYNVEKKDKKGRMKFDGNTGKGVILFDPLTLWCASKENRMGGGVMEFLPHVLHRYTERYLKPLGKENISTDKKIASIAARWKYFDVGGDEYSQKHNDKGILAYDVFLKGGGMLRGQMSNPIYVKFFTYVSDDQLYENQRETQQKITNEYYSLLREGKLVIKEKKKPPPY